MTKKMRTISIFAACAMCSLALPMGVSSLLANAETAVTPIAISNANFAMEKGAATRLNADDGYGLKFAASLSASDYEGIMANEDYSNISFGMLVMPYDYVSTYGDLTQETVFDEATAVYNWATYNGTAWEYKAEQGKTRIIHVTSNEMKQAENGNYYMEGAVKNILEENIARDFIGRSYIQYTENETVKYEFADWFNGAQENNVRSIAYVAQMAIADNGVNAPSVTDKAWLQKNYVDKVLVDETKADYAYIDRSKSVTTHTFNTPNGATALRVTMDDYTLVDFTAEDNTLSLTETLIANGLSAGVLKKGENTVYVHTVKNVVGQKPEYKIYKECIVIADKVFMQSDFNASGLTKANKMTETLNKYAAAGKYIVLGEDITIGEITMPAFATAAPLYGTLDGRGHGFLDITLGEPAGWKLTTVLARNYGVIENLYMEITGCATGGHDSNGLAAVGQNWGTVRNVYVKYNYRSTGYNATAGAVVGTLKSTTGSSGKVYNCIGEVTFATEADSYKVGTVVGLIDHGYNVAGSVKNCYGVTNNKTLAHASVATDVVYSTASAKNIENCANFKTHADLTTYGELSANKGWSKFWTMTKDTLKFGARTIYQAE